MRTSIATVCLSGSLDEKLTAVSAAGFDGVEIFEPDLVAAPGGPDEIHSRADDLGLTIDLYQPFRDLDSTDPDRFRRNLIRLERKFDVMERLGCDLLLVCSSPTRGAVHDDGLLVEQLGAAADVAQARGMRLAYEALAWGTHVNTYAHAWSLVDTVDHPSLGTCLDSFHILSRGDDPSAIGDIDGDKIFFLQLADAPHLTMDVLQWSRHHRCFPGQGTFDLAGFGAHVTRSGYTGPWSLEIFNDVFRESETGRTATDAHRSLLYLQDRVARVEASHQRESLHTAPDGGTLGSIVSVRLAAGPESADSVSTALGQLGFDLTAAHSAHGLQLFTHGPLAVAVDTTVDTSWTTAGWPDLRPRRPGEAPGVPATLPAIAQIGVRSDDPDAWLTRARSFDVPASTVGMPGVVSNGESSVIRMRVTDAVSMDLRSRESAAVWQRAFDLVRRDPPPAPEPFLSGVDHVALAVPADEWDGMMLLLRSVLGMTPHEGPDVIDAIGLVRSRALTVGEGAGAIRLSLNMMPSASRDTVRAPRPGGVSHVAFSTSDVISAADTMRRRGFEPIAVSDNYYDDLEARFDLDPSLLRSLREHGVLYDADDEGGEFLHFFTPLVGSDLFFEVTQRRGGYAGYGETNNAVRVAGLRRSGQTRSNTAARP